MATQVLTSSAELRAAQSTEAHWGLAAKSALEGLGNLPAGANLGLVYVTEVLADHLSSIVTFLRETTRLDCWLGAAGHGVIGPEGEIHEGPGLVLMVGRVAPEAVHPFDGFDPATFQAEHGAWLRGQRSVAGLVHADPREPLIAELVAGLAETAGAYLVGGLTIPAEIPTQVAGRVTGSGLSGALLGDGVLIATGMSQGCTPIGPPHRVTEVVDNVVIGLDGQIALEVLKAEAGDIIARDLRRAAGYIHVALPLEGSDSVHDYAVRNLMGIDPKRGWLAVGERLVAGDRLMFVRRDSNAAQEDMARMLDGLAHRLDGRPVKGGVYVSCVGRGPAMFGPGGREREMIRDILGDFPLVGFTAAGEICHDRLYGYTGVLALFL
jgi:small ligand-binding sensory domain FIST